MQKLQALYTWPVVMLAVAVLLVLPVPSPADHLSGTSCLDETAGGGLAGDLPCAAYTGETYGTTTLGTDTPDGNDTEEAVEAVLEYLNGTLIDITLVAGDLTGDSGDFNFNPDDITGGEAFDWSYSGSLSLAFLTVKADGGFAIFDINGLTSGSADISSLIDHNTSHVSFWTTGAQVSEPNTLFLLGTGLVLAGAAWRRRRPA